jgi:hypothetical protein
MAGFIFGAGTPYKSHADVMRQREIANALIQQSQAGASANSMPEGVANLGVGIMAALMGAKARRDEAKGKASYNDSFKAVTRSLLGGQGQQASGPFNGTVVPTSAPPPGGKPSGNVSPEIVKGIQATAQSLGINPVDLATAISYETAGTFDPAKKGPTTKWGTHRGLIQFGEPQAAQYGVDWNNPVGSQLGPEGAVAKYLKATGVKPGMGLLDIYSAINAGGVGLYNRSDAAAGGAPGTVADKVRDQMDGHRAKAMALLGGSGAPPMVQMASAAPSSGIGPMGFQAPQMPVQAGAPNGVQIMPAGAEPPQMAPAAPAMGNQPMTAYQRTFARSQEREGGNVGPIARGQMARVMGQDPAQAMAPPQGGQPMAGGFFTSMLPAGFPPEQAATVQQAEASLDGMPIEQIAELASSPYAEDWQKNLMQQYLEHRMKQQFAPPPDPLDRRTKELNIAKLERDLQPPAPSPTDDMREYQYAITQGYEGTFAEWQTENRKAGAPNSTQIGTIPPGYQVEYDADGRPVRMVPLPGSPPDIEANKTASAAASRDSKRNTSTDVITGAAEEARKLVGGYSTGLVGQALSPIGITDAAEVRRQVEVLKSIGSIESLTAMRRESPTGGALGAITDRENAMLAAAVGALDPTAGPERFRKALDNYELTLLQIVHGYDAGALKFEELKRMREGDASPASNQTEQPESFTLGADDIRPGEQVMGSDGRLYWKRENGTIWVQNPNSQGGWEQVR